MSESPPIVGTINHVVSALAVALNMSNTAVEAYANALKARGVIEKGVRGRGARPATAQQAARILVSLLTNGPSEVRDNFEHLCDLAPPPQDSMHIAIGEAVGAYGSEGGGPGFLDMVSAILNRYVDGGIADLVFRSEDDQAIHNGEMGPTIGQAWSFYGPSIEIGLSGPFPIGSIKFLPSQKLIDCLATKDIDKKPGDFVALGFVHRIYEHQRFSRTAAERERYSQAIEELSRNCDRGIKYERRLGGRELDACARALRGDRVE